MGGKLYEQRHVWEIARGSVWKHVRGSVGNLRSGEGVPAVGLGAFVLSLAAPGENGPSFLLGAALDEMVTGGGGVVLCSV